MSKKLFLALVPFLVFGMSACQRGNGGTSSGGTSGKDSGTSSQSSQASGDQSSGDESSADDSSEEGGSTDDSSQSGEASSWYVVGSGEFIGSGTAWSTEGGVNLIVNPTSEDPNATSEQWATVTFGVGDQWKVTDGTIWIQMDCVEEGTNAAYAADGSKQMNRVDDGFGKYNVNVLEAGSYDIYFKTYASANTEGTTGYSIWVQAHA
ncbi:MAG: hypothetical protein E7175_03485 [Erysipelotrichaceae bacterium]|nr:hypothetical protein [Erysipelotrichaceae bacterium]